MVIKYAMGEKDIMIAKRGKEEVEKRLKESLKDKEGLQYKVKTLGTERTRTLDRAKGTCRLDPSLQRIFVSSSSRLRPGAGNSLVLR